MPDLTTPMFNVQIDGVWHQFPKGTRVIEACAQAGAYVPRYCYHKKLSSPGNCRMCLIEMGMPRIGPDRKPELGADGKPIINWMASIIRSTVRSAIKPANASFRNSVWNMARLARVFSKTK